MSQRVIPIVVYTDNGRVVLGDVDVDSSTANLNEEGAALIDQRMQPPVDNDGNPIEGDLPVGLQFVLNPYFKPAG